MSESDGRWLAEAVELARRGTGIASPNPMVGAVVVDTTGLRVGEGCYSYEGRKHAEVLALEQAGGRSQGATLYVSLEPCSIHGRTPPCVRAVLEAGIARVVCASRDRNPNIDGAGLDALRQAGVEVFEASGEVARQAERLNQAFFHFARTGRPLVTLKTALTLDGKIAAPDDNTGWITSSTARAHVHRVRHSHDAIMTGIGTVQADDCRLTDRTGLPRRRRLQRVIVDSLLRIPTDSRIVESVQGDLLVATTSAATERRRRALERAKVAIRVFDSPTGRVDLHALFAWLGRRDITSVMVEGGAKLNWALLEGGAVDKILLYFAPKILGGFDSLPMVGGAGRRSRSGAIRVRNLRTSPVGPDEFLVDATVVNDHVSPSD